MDDVNGRHKNRNAVYQLGLDHNTIYLKYNLTSKTIREQPRSSFASVQNIYQSTIMPSALHGSACHHQRQTYLEAGTFQSVLHGPE